MFDSPVIQVAGVRDLEEARMLVATGVTHIGFPLRLPVNVEDTTEAAAAEIIRSLPIDVMAVLITYLDSADAIHTFCSEMGVRVVQLHGNISREELDRLRGLDPGLAVIKSLVVGQHEVSELESVVEQFCGLADAFITDTYDPETGATGATGKTHDWAISRHLVEISECPVILAGGLTPDNVRDAIFHVLPAGVDAHTGLEDSYGRKDTRKVERFIAETRAGFRQLREEA